MNRYIKWLLSNSVVVALIFFGFFPPHYNIYAKNIVIFLTCFLLFPASAIVLIASFTDEFKKSVKKLHLIPLWLDMSYDIIVLSIFASTGHFITAFCYVAHMVCLTIGRNVIKKNS